MLLSAAIIVRDEAENLPGCLASIAGVVDEIVVVDTGSTDDTVELARAAGAVVAFQPWAGHFGRARNAALDLAHGRWILYIDADERLSVAAADLRERLEHTDAVAGLVRFRVGPLYTRHWEYRLFRNRPDIRFHGAVHETIVPDLDRLLTAGATVVETSAEIDHFGYEGDQRSKHLRYIPLLERQLLDDPERLFLWFHLGVAHEGLGNPEAAERAWAQGVAVASRRPSESWIAVLLYVRLALLRIHAGQDVSDLAAEMAHQFPHDPLTAWVCAHQAMDEGRWVDAVPLLEGLAEIDGTTLIHPVLAYDVRMFRELAPHCLGLCWFHLGDDGRAEAWFARAVDAAPDVEEYRVKRELARARGLRHQPAQ